MEIRGVGWVRNLDERMADIKAHREYDFTYEKIENETLPKKGMVLMKLGAEGGIESKIGAKPKGNFVFSKVIAFSNLMDPALLFSHGFGKEELRLEVENPGT